VQNLTAQRPITKLAQARKWEGRVRIKKVKTIYNKDKNNKI
jgi:hypothetical protein